MCGGGGGEGAQSSTPNQIGFGVELRKPDMWIVCTAVFVVRRVSVAVGVLPAVRSDVP